MHDARDKCAATWLCAATLAPLPRTPPKILQHTGTHCNTRQHTTTRCNTLQHLLQTRAMRETDVLQHLLHSLRCFLKYCNILLHTDTALHCNTLQHAATPAEDTRDARDKCAATLAPLPQTPPKILQHTAIHRHSNTLQHAATHCNTCCRHARCARQMCSDTCSTPSGASQHPSSSPSTSSDMRILSIGRAPAAVGTVNLCNACVAVCCSVLQCVAVCCGVLQCVAVS